MRGVNHGDGPRLDETEVAVGQSGARSRMGGAVWMAVAYLVVVVVGSCVEYFIDGHDFWSHFWNLTTLAVIFYVVLVVSRIRRNRPGEPLTK